MNSRDLFKKFMCGIMSAAMMASLSTAAFAVETGTSFTVTLVQTEKEKIGLIANVVEIINSKSILVEWVNATYGQTIVYCEEMPDLRVGNYAYVESDGIFMESYPLQLHADSVLVLEETMAPDENLDITTYTISETTISTDINSEITDVLETSNCLEASEFCTTEIQTSESCTYDESSCESSNVLTSLYGTVVDVWTSGTVIIKVNNLGDIVVHCDNVENMPHLEIGMNVYIAFDGYFLETVPLQIYALSIEIENSDILNKCVRGVVKEVTGSDYIVKVGELLITVEKDQIIDSEEVVVGDIIGFYGCYSGSIDESNPLNWGTNTEIMKITLGDIDGDGLVRINDVIWFNKYLIGLLSLSSRCVLSADIDNNGVIDMGDNLLIAQYLCGKITDLNYRLSLEESTPEETSFDEVVCIEFGYDVAEVVEVIDDNTVAIRLGKGLVVNARYDGSVLELAEGDVVNAFNAGGCVTWDEFYNNYRVTSKRILGDANLDGGVNELDVEFINSKLEQGETIYLYNWNEWDWNNTDVNSDYEINYKDVSLIEKYLAGEILSFDKSGAK